MSSRDAKRRALEQARALNSRPEKVEVELFHTHPFFDPEDKAQVKYEMLRCVEKNGVSVTKAASEFGFSRLSFYRILSAFKKHGLAGLVPKRRGPREGHKLSEKIMICIEEKIKTDEITRADEIKQFVEKKFDITIHPRSIERALERRGKKKGSTK